MYKRILSTVLCAILLLFPFCSSAVDISAQSAILIEQTSGEIIFEKNAYKVMPMASTTKIMTAFVALKNGSLDDIVTINDKMVGAEGSSIYLKCGEKLSLKQLLYALLLASANDAAEAIAIHISGSVEAFATLMNQTAQDLGLNNTHYMNPHGLDNDEHYTTAYDLAKLTAIALEEPTFKEIVSTYKYIIPQNAVNPERVIVNHNKLLKIYNGAIGVKTGFTKRCGRCLVSAAKRDDVTLVAVTISAPDDWNDHKAMLDYGFEQFESVLLADVGSLCFEIPVACGSESKVLVSNKSQVKLALRKEKSDSIECKIYSIGGALKFAPIEKNEHLADAVFYHNGNIIASIPLYAQHDIYVKTKQE